MKKIVTILLLLVSLTGHAQAPKGQVELFCGAEMEYASVNFLRYYDILLNLTPGTKWHLGENWLFAGQMFLPIYNEGYIDKYNMIRLNIAAISKELHFPSAKQYMKVSAGLFSHERGGIDLRWFYPVNDWLMLSAQAGLTSYWTLGFKIGGDKESDFGKDWKITGIARAHFWLNAYNTEIRLSGGRYIDGDYGTELDIMRHFRHVTIGVYGQYHEVAPDRFPKNTQWYAFGVGPHREGGGFKVTVMLPPYKKSKKKFVLRPSSNLSFQYYAQFDRVSMQMYATDPEENEREYSVEVPWGIERRGE